MTPMSYPPSDYNIDYLIQIYEDHRKTECQLVLEHFAAKVTPSPPKIWRRYLAQDLFDVHRKQTTMTDENGIHFRDDHLSPQPEKDTSTGHRIRLHPTFVRRRNISIHKTYEDGVKLEEIGKF
ncbi:hypothetical protein CPB85DRAFT_1255585 [Mucidula mucida]|nr:hypothetical protein CPB85DRAFT_1255585 [Mucidula mucida]